MLREIKKFAPHYAEILSQQYVGRHGGPAEIEAFWMELQDPAYAIKEIGNGCPDVSSGSGHSIDSASASGPSDEQATDPDMARFVARAEIVGAKAAADCNISKGLLTRKRADEIFAEFVKTKNMHSWVARNKNSVNQASSVIQYAFDDKCEFRDTASEEKIGLQIIKYILD